MKRNKQVGAGGAPAYVAGVAVFASIVGGVKQLFAKEERAEEIAQQDEDRPKA